MSRRIRALLTLVVVSFALTAACADATVPQPASKACDTQNSNTCK